MEINASGGGVREEGRGEWDEGKGGGRRGDGEGGGTRVREGGRRGKKRREKEG